MNVVKSEELFKEILDELMTNSHTVANVNPFHLITMRNKFYQWEKKSKYLLILCYIASIKKQFEISLIQFIFAYLPEIFFCKELGCKTFTWIPVGQLPFTIELKNQLFKCSCCKVYVVDCHRKKCTNCERELCVSCFVWTNNQCIECRCEQNFYLEPASMTADLRQAL